MSFFPIFLLWRIKISQLKCEIEKNKMELHLEFSQLEKANSKNKDMAIFRTSIEQKNNKGLNVNKLKHSQEKEEQKGENITLREMASIFKKKAPISCFC